MTSPSVAEEVLRHLGELPPRPPLATGPPLPQLPLALSRGVHVARCRRAPRATALVRAEALQRRAESALDSASQGLLPMGCGVGYAAPASGSRVVSPVVKLFMGGDFDAFRGEVRAVFGDVKVVRPEATRGASMEIYLVGLGKR